MDYKNINYKALLKEDVQKPAEALTQSDWKSQSEELKRKFEALDKSLYKSNIEDYSDDYIRDITPTEFAFIEMPNTSENKYYNLGSIHSKASREENMFMFYYANVKKEDFDKICNAVYKCVAGYLYDLSSRADEMPDRMSQDLGGGETRSVDRDTYDEYSNATNDFYSEGGGIESFSHDLAAICVEIQKTSPDFDYCIATDSKSMGNDNLESEIYYAIA